MQENAETLPQKSPLGLQVIGILVSLATITIVLTFLLLRPPADAYTTSVLLLAGDRTNGRSIFVMNCVACHGQWADGKVGPSLHGVSKHKSAEQLIHQIISGETPPMPKFQADPQKMADLLSYLKQL